MKMLILFATLFSGNAFARVDWVDRYALCEVAFVGLADPGPVIHNHLSDLAVGKWGRTVIAFPGKNQGKEGMWLMGPSVSYFGPLPKGRVFKSKEENAYDVRDRSDSAGSSETLHRVPKIR